MQSSTGPASKIIEGGCLCEAVRYKISFPKDHDLSNDTLGCICQCTQCRKQTGSFFLATLTVPISALGWQGDSEDKIKRYRKSENIARGFCGDCGSFLFWHPDGQDISVATGSLDPLYLFGEGVENKSGVPPNGFAKEIFGGKFNVEFCESEIKGVTDDMPILQKGKRCQGDSSKS
ncbi:glutathione-dependent formaldehyde-activating GFA [Fusarium napiforme]|uniref:Glutathione-dependent formaldehyde-activating GFA n=1 Tax=Fusarium napiforme TaxID=42672 RepID=A0A8H5JEI5_9HYPO|nr:glutathione-dependent formaldehyde-activating GFA [Fusarium napiforme]